MRKRLGEYWHEARGRAQRRKSAWNLLLIPFFLIGAAVFYWIFSLPILYLWSFGAPKDVFLSGFSTVGLIFYHLGLMFCSIAPGMLTANYCLWLIPKARRVLNQESQNQPASSFKASNRGLIKVGFVFLMVFYPSAHMGGLSYFGASQKGVNYRSGLEFRLVPWADLKAIEAQCYSKRSAGVGHFVLTFKNGKSVDLFSSGPQPFFRSYPELVTALRGVHYDFRIESPPSIYSGNPCPPQWVPYLLNKPGSEAH